MRDFTMQIYEVLLESLLGQGYSFQTLRDFITDPKERVIVLRHDIDARRHHAMSFAQIQAKNNVYGTYYFRMIPKIFDSELIQSIHQMGHEIGYHYEDMDLAKGDENKAIHLFEKNLQKLREIVPIKTICMHGSPLSKFDNREIWKHIQYRDYDIIAEPYFDIDFNDVFYLTDTGGRWDGASVSIRDKVNSTFDLTFSSTDQIIHAIGSKELPDKIMFNFHPHRWTDDLNVWLKERYFQKVKNVAKYILNQIR